MSWLKIDDKLAFHPKVLTAGNAAMGLWVRAGSWSRGQQTNGHIPKSMIPALGGRPADTKALVSAGLWEPNGDGYDFHDWDEWQPADTDLRANKARGSLGAHRRWHTDRPSPDCSYCNGTAVADR